MDCLITLEEEEEFQIDKKLLLKEIDLPKIKAKKERFQERRSAF
jgi:DNA-directed RNA polymerase subunit H (RpoH/RPB5)